MKIFIAQIYIHRKDLMNLCDYGRIETNYEFKFYGSLFNARHLHLTQIANDDYNHCTIISNSKFKNSVYHEMEKREEKKKEEEML